MSEILKGFKKMSLMINQKMSQVEKYIINNIPENLAKGFKNNSFINNQKMSEIENPIIKEQETSQDLDFMAEIDKSIIELNKSTNYNIGLVRENIISTIGKNKMNKQTLKRNFIKAQEKKQRQLTGPKLNILAKSFGMNVNKFRVAEKIKAIDAAINQKASQIKLRAKFYGITRKKGESYRCIIPNIISEDKKITDTIRIKLRNNRTVKQDLGIITQNPFLDLNTLSIGDIFSNKELIYFHTHFHDIFLKEAHEALYKKKDVNSAMVQALYISFKKYGEKVNYDGLNDVLKDVYRDEIQQQVVDRNILDSFGISEGDKLSRHIKYTKIGAIFNKKTDVKDIGFSISSPDSDVRFLFIGYRIASLFTNGVQMTNQTFNSLKAFKPSSNRKFHDLSVASTSLNGLCIYETFLHVKDILSIKHSRRKSKEYRDKIYIRVINYKI
jgi:hypothetical protein